MKNNYFRKLIAVLMIVVSLVIGPVNAMAASYGGVTYSTDYRNWKQSDRAWGGKRLGNQGTISSWGCLITALASLMVMAGVEDPAKFCPGTLADRYESRGFIIHSWGSIVYDGNLSSAAYSRQNSPNFYEVGYSNYHPTPYNKIYNDISAHLARGEYAIVCVAYGNHFVAVRGCSNGTVYIMDPANSGKTTLKQYDGGIEFARFFAAKKPSKAKTKKISWKGVNFPTTSIKYRKCFSVKGTISSDYKLTSVTVAVYDTRGRMRTGLTSRPNSYSYDIKARADRYVYFNRLSKGTYYYRIKAKNAAGTSITLLNKKFTIR